MKFKIISFLAPIILVVIFFSLKSYLSETKLSSNRSVTLSAKEAAGSLIAVDITDQNQQSNGSLENTSDTKIAPPYRPKSLAWKTDPKKKSLMAAQMRQGFDRQYGPLFYRLHANEELRERLKDIILERQFNLLELFNELDPKYIKGTPEYQSVLDTALKNIVTNAANFLSKEQCDIVEDYFKTLEFRGRIGLMTRALAGTPDSLTLDQTDMLIAVLKNSSSIGKESFPAIDREIALPAAAQFLNDSQLRALEQLCGKMEMEHNASEEIRVKAQK